MGNSRSHGCVPCMKKSATFFVSRSVALSLTLIFLFNLWLMCFVAPTKSGWKWTLANQPVSESLFHSFEFRLPKGKMAKCSENEPKRPKKNEPTKWHHSKCVSFLTKICSIDFDLFAYIRICICTQHTMKALPQRHAYA